MNNETYTQHLLRHMLVCESIPVHDDTCDIPLYQAVVEIPSLPAPVSPVDEPSAGALMLAGVIAVLIWRKLNG